MGTPTTSHPRRIYKLCASVPCSRRSQPTRGSCACGSCAVLVIDTATRERRPRRRRVPAFGPVQKGMSTVMMGYRAANHGGGMPMGGITVKALHAQHLYSKRLGPPPSASYAAIHRILKRSDCADSAVYRYLLYVCYIALWKSRLVWSDRSGQSPAFITLLWCLGELL